MKIKYTVEFELTDTNKRLVDFVEVPIEDIESDGFIREILFDELNDKHSKECTCYGECSSYFECDDGVEVENLEIKDRELINL